MIAENAKVGPLVSMVTVLSTDVDAAFIFPNASVTLPAAIDGMTVPEAVTPVAAIVQVILSDVLSVHVIPDAEPF
jgi:hypothetical protein